MKEIPLTQGLVAMVDDEDFDRLARRRWFAVRQGPRAYAMRKLRLANGRRVNFAMHREILGTTGVDHINSNGLDNRRSNLRPANQSENTANARKRKLQCGRPTLSRFKGVSRDRGRWRAQIRVHGQLIYLGNFVSEVDAARAYNAAAAETFGAFARLNPIEGAA